MSLTCLETLLAKAEALAAVSPSALSASGDQHAKPAEPLTTTAVCNLVVVPACTGRQCAYLDFVDADEVGPATVFVSHAWRYRFANLVAALRSHTDKAVAAGQPPPRYFFDLVVNNQILAPARSHSWWSGIFRRSVARIGRVLLVIEPWDAPIPLSRAWCLWEIFCAIDQDVEMELGFSVRTPAEMERRLMSQRGFTLVRDALAQLDARRAEAFKRADRDMIFAAIEAGVGFEHLNRTVKAKLRELYGCLLLGLLEVRRGSGQPAAYACMLLLTARALHDDFGALDRSEALAREAYSRLVACSGGESGAMVAAALAERARHSLRRGRVAVAQEQLRRALGLHDSLEAKSTASRDGMAPGNRVSRARLHGLLGEALAAGGDMAAARTEHEHQLAMIQGAEGEEGEEGVKEAESLALLNLGRTRLLQLEVEEEENKRRGEAAEVQRLLEQALAAGEESLGAGSLLACQAHCALGRLALWRGGLAEAARLTDLGLQASVAAYGLQHPLNAVCIEQLAAVATAGGELTVALERYDMALAIVSKTRGLMHPATLANLERCRALSLKLALAEKAAMYEEQLDSVRHEAAAEEAHGREQADADAEEEQRE